MSTALATTMKGDQPAGAPVIWYVSMAAAERRVSVLRAAAGIWPGIVSGPGGYRLTVDPDDIRRPHRAIGEADA